MFGPLAPLWMLLLFALVGVVAGIAQMHVERSCPCCKLQVSWSMSTCPHCRCRLD